ncbi:unnamed protein product [Camellia sinensis]
MEATIPIFDGENYEFWNVKMKTIFLSMDLWDTEQNTVQNNRGNQKENAKALSLIQQGVSDWILEKIMKVETAKEAWDILLKKFQRAERPTLSFNKALATVIVPANILKSKQTNLIVATLTRNGNSNKKSSFQSFCDNRYHCPDIIQFCSA